MGRSEPRPSGTAWNSDSTALCEPCSYPTATNPGCTPLNRRCSTPGTRVNDTGPPDGQHGGRDRRRGQRHYDPSTDYLNLTRGVTVPRGVGGILEGEPWGGISVPWVERDTNRCIVNLSPLRGMLKVATLGCDGPDGRLTLLFVGRVAQFVREHNLVILPSQLMRVSPIKAESDMTVSHIRDHFKPVLNHGMDFSVEDEPLYDEDM